MDPYIIVIILAMLPTIEALGAISVGILIFNLNPLAVFILAFTFNTILFFPVYATLQVFYKHVEKYKRVHNFVEGVRHKGKKVIDKYGFWGLTVYLALPIPFSGTWTGTLIAWLLGIEKKKALLAVMVGVFAACLFAMLLSLFAAGVLYWLGAPRASPI